MKIWIYAHVHKWLPVFISISSSSSSSFYSNRVLDICINHPCGTSPFYVGMYEED
jgi:hypothetical protein